MKKVDEKGVAANGSARAEIAAVVAAEITGEEQAVALFTKEGVRGERMWLIKPEGKPWVVPEGTTVTKLSHALSLKRSLVLVSQS